MTSSKIYSGIRVMLLFFVSLAIVNLSIGEQRFCGNKLRNVIELMCPNGVNGYKTKRSSISLDEDISTENTEEDFNFGLSLDMLPLMDSSNSGIAKIRRRRHGIAHECCDKPCSMKEIVSYCRN
ncbi:bombyxin A-1 homolog [Eupeodes corollae]|uniref:bombyxin A-1 homolog n=1 Tax=Eupeodes corollae TaxID=290404 RepID=UPI0024906AFA|nr:bombyxin A-1 homolog [Eupeodes corollae]